MSGLRIARVELRGASERRLGSTPIAEVHQRGAESVVRGCEPRRAGERFAERVDRSGRVCRGEERVAEFEPARRVGVLARDGLAVEPHGLAWIAEIGGEIAEGEHRLGVVRRELRCTAEVVRCARGIAGRSAPRPRPNAASESAGASRTARSNALSEAA